MTFPIAMNPPLEPGVYSGIFAPEVSQVAIADDDRRVMGQLASVLLDPTYQTRIKLDRLYYDSLNVVPSLGISVPPELEQLRGVLGWCAAGVDARSERLTVMGFRMPNQTETDVQLQRTWQANNLDAESTLVHDDALIVGRSFVIVGVDDDMEEPLITVEAPENMIGSWDPRTRDLSAAFQTYIDVDPASQTYLRQLATLYTRMSTVQLVRGDRGWEVQDRDDHGMGFVPVEMFTHRPTAKNRYGVSVMNASWRNTQDRGCRTLVRSEVSSEFYATMKIFLLGVTEASFKKSDGSMASAWETFIGRISTLKPDAMGNLPDVKTVAGQSPDGLIRTFDQQAQIMSGHTGLPPQYLGIYSDGNPTSADAIRMSDFRLKTAADRLTVWFGNGWENVMRKSRRVKGIEDAETDRLETDWAYTGIPTPNADAVTVSTQIQAGMIPPTADDALAATGWTPVQRARIKAERDRYAGLNTINRMAGLLPTGQPAGRIDGQPGGQQPLDGEQPQALAALNSARTTDGAVAG
ncbi:portal protein [Mycobacterium phage Nairb]|uniref:Portal protein n=5 Tax=Bernalvirus bernal13 TaxID=1982102 RepID=A0A2P1JRT7_9CAUD|nr:portal protein [Mycobacterium phage Bernal13]AIT13417.1 portal protein [Mycobacterium phage RonRayGun]ASJ79085.1 portal protein [Mycobacterium phage ZenTime222]AVO21792.1 portal protein [Mycobacterium phage Nairb]QBP28849.1 portal protein [Mycobacterium phage Ibrahim]QHB47410.1 portal protein [Mycobacterium phage Whitty]